jgi:hypothetical protein
MNPVAVIILICSVSLSRSDCQPDNAIDVLVGQKVDNEMMCGFLGQSIIATTELTPRGGEETLRSCVYAITALSNRQQPNCPNSYRHRFGVSV